MKLRGEKAAIHPGHKWFYNRENAYSYMGFDSFYTIDYVPEGAETVNYYISDKVTAQMIIDDYKKYLDGKNENGYFGFTVTIQNHGPYPSTKTHQPLRVVKNESMTDETYHVLNNYVGGLYDSDMLLKQVRDFLNEVSEPTVLLFFGDHLPYLGGENEGYKAIDFDIDSGTLEAEVRKHSVPYILWMNPAARELTALQGRQILQGENSLISSNFLSAELFNALSDDIPPFFRFLYNLKNRVSVIAPGYFMVDGEFTTTATEDISSMLEQYKHFQYYNINEYKDTP